jgi:hypothetical protein
MDDLKCRQGQRFRNTGRKTGVGDFYAGCQPAAHQSVFTHPPHREPYSYFVAFLLEDGDRRYGCRVELLSLSPVPGPLEDYAVQFGALFDRLSQRQSFRIHLAGSLLPRDRPKTVTAIAGVAS